MRPGGAKPGHVRAGEVIDSLSVAAVVAGVVAAAVRYR